MATARAALDLERLAETDPTVAPLARLQVVALRAADDRAWEDGIPSLPPRGTEAAAPRLHGTRLAVDIDRLRALLRQLAATLDSVGHPEGARLGRLFASAELDPTALLRASLVHDDSALEAVAARADADPAVLGVLAQAAALPLLAACGRRAAGALAPDPWPHGYCPICAAWPTLARCAAWPATWSCGAGGAAAGGRTGTAAVRSVGTWRSTASATSRPSRSARHAGRLPAASVVDTSKCWPRWGRWGIPRSWRATWSRSSST